MVKWTGALGIVVLCLAGCSTPTQDSPAAVIPQAPTVSVSGYEQLSLLFPPGHAIWEFRLNVSQTTYITPYGFSAYGPTDDHNTSYGLWVDPAPVPAGPCGEADAGFLWDGRATPMAASYATLEAGEHTVRVWNGLVNGTMHLLTYDTTARSITYDNVTPIASGWQHRLVTAFAQQGPGVHDAIASLPAPGLVAMGLEVGLPFPDLGSWNATMAATSGKTTCSQTAGGETFSSSDPILAGDRWSAIVSGQGEVHLHFDFESDPGPVAGPFGGARQWGAAVAFWPTKG